MTATPVTPTPETWAEVLTQIEAFEAALASFSTILADLKALFGK